MTRKSFFGLFLISFCNFHQPNWRDEITTPKCLIVPGARYGPWQKWDKYHPKMVRSTGRRFQSMALDSVKFAHFPKMDNGRYTKYPVVFREVYVN